MGKTRSAANRIRWGRGIMLLAAVFVPAVLSSCSGDDSPSDEDLQRTFLAADTGKVWRISAFFVGEEDQTDSLLACDRDDWTTFRPDGSYSLTEGETRCNPTDTFLIESGGWILGIGQVILFPESAEGSFFWEILLLSSDTLRVRSVLGDQVRTVTYFNP